MKVLIVNLTRFGDLVQTQPLLSALAAGGIRADLLCLENFVPALPMLRGVGEVWPLRGARLLAGLERGWMRALRDVTAFAARIREEGKYSHIVNLTLSSPARLLTRMLARDGAQVLGFDIDDEGFGHYSGSWAALFAATSGVRGGSPFNVADMFRMMALPLLPDLRNGPESGRLAPPSREARAWARELLAAHPFAKPGENLVAFQLGASNPARQWPVENFVALGAALRARGFVPVLLGAAAEKNLAERFSAAARFEHIDATGRTDIPQLAALLENCRLLATNDTGTMHLASGLAVPILAFFLATAQPWDTAPYSCGACCLEPALACHPCQFNDDCAKDYECRARIRPEFAASLALAFLEGRGWEAGVTDEARENVRVWLTARDGAGFAALESLSGHQDERRAAWLAWQRWFWRHALDAMDGRKADAPAPHLALEAGLAAEVAPALDEAARGMESLAGAAALVGKNPRAGKIFLDGCEKIQLLFDLCPPLRVLGFFWRQLRHESSDMALFASQTAIFAKSMKDFAQNLARNVA